MRQNVFHKITILTRVKTVLRTNMCQKRLKKFISVGDRDTTCRKNMNLDCVIYDFALLETK